MKLPYPIYLFTLCLLLMPALTQARATHHWQPQELVQKADLVVIATVYSTGDDKNYDPKVPHPGLGTWIPVETVFDVQAVLKGQISGKLLTVRHYRENRAYLTIDGPAFITFAPNQKKRCLVYLQKRGDHFEPVTGQYDPDQSFYQIQSYSG